jgi:hypothetical protein
MRKSFGDPGKLMKIDEIGLFLPQSAQRSQRKSGLPLAPVVSLRLVVNLCNLKRVRSEEKKSVA